MPSLRPLLAALLVVGALPAGVAAGAPAAGVVDPAATGAPPAAQTASATAPNLTVRSGPIAGGDALDSLAALRRAVATDRLPATDRVAVGDPLVVAVRDDRLADALGAGNATAAFFDRRATADLNVSVEQTNPTPQRQAKVVSLDPNATRVLVDARNATTHLVIDTARVNATYGDDADAPSATLRTDDRFEVRLALDGDLSSGANATVAATTFAVRVREAHVAVDDERGDRLYRSPAPNRTVTAVTNLAPGRNATLVVRGRDDPDTAANESFVRRTTVTARPAPDRDDDRFPTRIVGSVDLSGVPEGALATVDVRFGGVSLVEEPPTLAVRSVTASVAVRETLPNATAGYPAVRVNATLSRGGFVVLHRGSPTGPVAGVSAWLLPGRHHNLTVYVGTPTDDAGDLVAVAHRDGDLDREFASASADPPYATSGAAVARTDFAPRFSPASTPRPPSGTTTTTTTTPDPTPAPPPPTTSPPPTTTTTPGFGPVAALVAALVVAALLAARD